MGVLGGVQRYYNFSALVDGDEFYLEYVLEHPLNRSSSHNLHLPKQILMKRKKKKKRLCRTCLGFGDENTLDYSDQCDKKKVGHPKKKKHPPYFFTCTFWMRCACFSKIFGLIFFQFFKKCSSLNTPHSNHHRKNYCIGCIAHLMNIILT